MLDPIITTLSKYYQTPVCQKPLDADQGTGGVASPMTVEHDKPARQKRKVMVRPMPESKYIEFENWLKTQTWENVTNAETDHEQAQTLQDISINAIDKFFPQKEVSFTSDDEPWVNSRIKEEIRKRKRIYSRHRKSKACVVQNKRVQNLVKSAKRNFYQKQINDCMTARNGQWYSNFKRMCKYDQLLSEPVEVEEITEKPHKEQANLILDSVLKVNNQYSPLLKEDIDFPFVEEESIPYLTEIVVESYMKQIKTKPSTPPNDIPAHIVKRFSKYFCKPLTHSINTCLKRGEWPDIWKIEAITPVPKVIPPKKIN